MSHDSPIIQIQTNVNHLCLQGLIGRHSGNKPTPPKDRRSPIRSQGRYAHLGSGNKSPLTPRKKKRSKGRQCNSPPYYLRRCSTSSDRSWYEDELSYQNVFTNIINDWYSLIVSWIYIFITTSFLTYATLRILTMINTYYFWFF